MSDSPINLGAITEALNNKTDTDVQNTTSVGSVRIAHLSMPSTSYTTLSAPASSGAVYTAPADGYMFAESYNSTQNAYFQVSACDNDNTSTIFYYEFRTYTVTTNPFSIFLPLAKGQKFRVDYNGTPTWQHFDFYYAKGSEPQA